MNIMLGPGPSSVATRVMGTGLEENLGWEAWRERVGRSDRTEEGRDGSTFAKSSDSFRETSFVPELPEAAFNELARLETEAGFLFGLSERLTETLGAEVVGATVTSAALVPGCVSHWCLPIRSGTLISFSPVDFLEGGGPLMLSPWLLLRLISFAFCG